MADPVLYVADAQTEGFGAARGSVDVVCAGDSITGWNNYGPRRYWPYSTYPQYLSEMCEPLGLSIADGGIAGEVSGNGLRHVAAYLDLFPNAHTFVIGFGTNDLGLGVDLAATSRTIIQNVDRMAQAVVERGKRCVLFNVPYANKAMYSSDIAESSHLQRDYHNEQLQEHCAAREIPLVDICSHIQARHLADEVHPNADGARIIAEQIFAELARIAGEASD